MATPASPSTVAPDRAGTAVCPGSYDPVTLGHLDIIGRASAIFERVIVAVVNLPMRKQKTLFSAEERCGMLRTEVEKFPNVQVESFDRLIVDFAREHGANAIVKGLRAISDFEYEFEMNQLNRKMAPDVETIYMMSSPQYSFLSSSGVKEIATFGGPLDDLVPRAVAERLEQELKR
jgi:pantetheine-phosphate adenylyltransferase